jgi:hypothetical protein
MSIEWDSRSRNLEAKIIEQHQSPYDEKKNKKKVIGQPNVALLQAMACLSKMMMMALIE